MKVLVINGPNLNLLDRRKKEIYGNSSLEEILKLLKDKGKELGINIQSFQSNHEGYIIDKIHEVSTLGIDGIIINPGALTHYSISIRDAIEMLNIPVIEVHLSNIYNREGFRSNSVIAPVCDGQISGLGINSYIIALEGLKLLQKNRR